MTLQDLITLHRAQAQDQKAPYFCSDELLTLYANEAQDEACRRSVLLRDSATTDICRVAVPTGAEAVALDPRVVHVLRARLSGEDVTVLSSEEMDALHPNWEADTLRAKPLVLVRGLTTDALHLWPMPDKDYELRLTVQRLALKPMADLNDSPEIRREAQPALVEWMLFKAYSRQDTEIFNDAKAKLAEGNFIREFGRKASARNESWVRDGQAMMPAPLA